MTSRSDALERRLRRALRARRLDVRPLRRAVVRRAACGLTLAAVGCTAVVLLFTQRSREVSDPPALVTPRIETPQPHDRSRAPEGVLYDTPVSARPVDAEPAAR